jgi:cyclohexanone monooxygenase
MSADLSVGIIGAGPGGLASGMLLVRTGFRDFQLADVSARRS